MMHAVPWNYMSINGRRSGHWLCDGVNEELNVQSSDLLENFEYENGICGWYRSKMLKGENYRKKFSS